MTLRVNGEEIPEQAILVELKRLMAEKAELERQFNDLAVLRAQVSKLKEELSIDVAVNDAFVEPTIKAIIKGARTGKIGDGKIFVFELEQVYRIRTGETGADAL